MDQLLKKRAIRMFIAALVVISVFVMIITSVNAATATVLIALKNTGGEDLGVHVSDLEAMGIEITCMDEYFVTARVTEEQIDMLRAGGYVVGLEEGEDGLTALDAGLVRLEEGEDGLTALDAGMITGPVAIFQDKNPWNRIYNQNILTANNITHTTYGSGDMGTVDLSGFDKVVIASQQSYSFYQALSANRSWFETYVANGGTLEFHGASQYFVGDDWSGLSMPGDITIAPQNSTNANNLLTIQNATHPLVTTPNVINNTDIDNWGLSAHSYFTGTANLPTVVITEDEFNQPVLVEFSFGNGCVLATMMPLEAIILYPDYSLDHRVLENVLLYKGETGTIETIPILSISTDKTTYNLSEVIEVTMTINRSEEYTQEMVMELELQEPGNDSDMLYQSPSFVMPAVFQSEVTVSLKIDQSIWIAGGEYAFIATLRDPTTDEVIDQDSASFEIDDEMPSMEKMWINKLKKFLP